MGSLCVSGWHTAMRRWPVVLLLFLANLVTGLLATAVSWVWLSIALDNSLATRTLLTDLDTNVFVDLFVHHGESLRAWSISAAGLVLVTVMIGVWLNATAVVAVNTDAPLGACLHRGLDLFPTYFGLWVLTGLVNASGLSASFLLGRALTRWTVESPSEVTFYWGVAAAAAVGAALLLFSTTVHDHARIRSTAASVGFVRAYAWAFNFVCRRERRAIPLTLLLLGAGCSAWLIYQTVGMLVPTTSTVKLTVSLAWGEALLLLRMVLRLWLFAADSDLQNAHKAA
jgi:hypothetical protein